MYDEKLFGIIAPESIAVVGASKNPDKIGYQIVENIYSTGYEGKVYPINPNIDEIFGLKGYAYVKDVPDKVDVAIIVVPADRVLNVVKDCAEKKVDLLVLITSGFSEVGNIKEEEEIVRICKEAGMRLIGPNVFGIASTISNYNGTFGPELPYRGKIVFVIQSGALGVALNGWTHLDTVGLSSIVSIGNMSEVDFGDLIELFSFDRNTNCICLYVEGIKDGRKFFEICKSASLQKPIIALKAGKSERGLKAAASHTGSLAGTTAIYDAAFKQSGVISAKNLEDMFDLSLGLVCTKPMDCDRIIIITNGGGAGVLATDAAERYGLPIQDISPELQEELRGCMPEYGSTRNPVDLTGMAKRDDYEYAIKAAISDDKVDGIVVLFCQTTYENPQNVSEGILKVNKGSTKPIVVGMIGSSNADIAMSYLRGHDMAAYNTPDKCMNVIATSCRYGRYLQKMEGAHGEFESYKVDRDKVREIIGRSKKAILEHDAKEIFKAYGIPVPEEEVAHTKAQAKEIADKIGYPVVAKISSYEILHKSDAGGVKINLKTAEEVERAYEEILLNAKNYKPDARIEGVLIQHMAPQGKEMIIGTMQDSQFGPCIMFGLGGIFVEVLKDVVFRLAPITKGEAVEMIHEIKGYPILEGVRGEEGVDLNVIAECLSRFSQLAYDNPEIKEIDANPVFGYEKGAIVADARIILF